MLRNRYFAIHVIFVRVFVFCKYALVVFLSEIHLLFYSTPFYKLFSVLFNEIFIKSMYLQIMYQNLFKFAQGILFLNFNMKRMLTVIFLRFLFSLISCSSDVSLLYFFRLSKVWSMLHHGSVMRE